MLEKNVMVSFLKKFDQYPFCVKMDDDKYTIGEGMPQFTVSIKEKIPMDLLITSISICKGCLKTRRNFPIAFYQCFKRISGRCLD